MSVIVSSGNVGLSTASGFYRSDAYNVGVAGSVAVNTSQIVLPVTFANAGNCKGIILNHVYADSYDAGYYNVTVTLQQFVAGSWVDTLATKTLSPNAIFNGSIPLAAGWITQYEFTIPVAVTTAASTWRFTITQSSGGTGTKRATFRTSTGASAANISYITYSDVLVTASSGNDFVCVRSGDTVTVDTTFGLKAYAGTSDATYGYCAWLCRNTDPSIANVANLVWDGSSSKTLTIDGLIICFINY
jgi:hypothetical protein